ncbi:MAG: hypothetical protein IPO22_02110 [Anaerolineales bacterium]|nr:hypothetical protein [Anaerolineales bacterium]
MSKEVGPDAPLQMLITALGYDDYRSITTIGRVFAGTIEAGQKRTTHEVGWNQLS